MIITAITVPFTVISGSLFMFRKCKRYIRRRSLRKLLVYDKVVIHIPTRTADSILGEKRIKPVVAKEDYNTYEKLRNILLFNGFEVSLAYIPNRNDIREEYGELELIRDCANIVVCGPKNSRTVENIFAGLKGLDFVKGEEGWYFDDLIGNVQLTSSISENKKQYAFVGKLPIDDFNVLLICGIHAIGSDGVAYFLGDNKRLDNLLNQVGCRNFYCIIRSSYNYEMKEIYDANLTECVRILN